MQQNPRELTPMTDVLRKYWDSVDSKRAVEQPESLSPDECPICGGAGFFTASNAPVGHPLFGKPQRCTNPDCKAAQDAAKRALINYALPEKYQKLTFEKFEREIPAEAKLGKLIAFHAAVLFATEPDHLVSRDEAAKRAGYVFDPPDKVRNSLAFYGVPGMGKTGLAAAIMNRLVTSKVDVLYRRTSDLFIDLQGAYDNRDKADDAHEVSFAQRIERYRSAGVLVLDEWRMQKQTEPRLQWMEDIVRYRHGHRLPTIFTTNETPDSIYSHWGEQTAEAALEMALWIEMKGTKLRETRNAISEF